jgi:hypothetical protein
VHCQQQGSRRRGIQLSAAYETLNLIFKVPNLSFVQAPLGNLHHSFPLFLDEVTSSNLSEEREQAGEK